MKKIILTILVISLELSGFSQQTGTFTDTRDGKTYKTIKIGNHIWMAENLAFKADSGCWVYNKDQTNMSKYGYLYNFETAKTVCPTGWHLPSETEYEALLKNVGGGGKTAYRALLPSGSSGFSAAFGGWLYDGHFGLIGEYASFWSSSPLYDSLAWELSISRPFSEAYVSNIKRSCGFSVRCLKNN
jgi:uncharacterized protein (TIGR02145 family)